MCSRLRPKLTEIRSRLRAMRLCSRLRGVAIFVLELLSSVLSPARGPQFGLADDPAHHDHHHHHGHGHDIMMIIIIIINITSARPVV